MENKTVTIFSTPSCPYCAMAKDYFKKHDISYIEHDVAHDLEKRQEMLDKSGQLGVPVILIGDDVVIGFDKPKINELLNITS